MKSFGLSVSVAQPGQPPNRGTRVSTTLLHDGDVMEKVLNIFDELHGIGEQSRLVHVLALVVEQEVFGSVLESLNGFPEILRHTLLHQVH